MTMLGEKHGFLEVEPHDPAERRADRDVILLLHGLGGDKSDWSNPKLRGRHWDYRIKPKDQVNDGQPIPPPTFPIPVDPRDQAGLSPKRDDIRSWRDVLLSKGHTVINYAQDGNQDVVETPLSQLEKLIVPFIRDEVLVDQLAGKRIVVLCHSRGGILARSYLKNHKDVAPEWISKIITLCSPHHGTRAPETKQRLADEATVILAVGGFFFAAGLLLAFNQLLDIFDVSDGATQLLPSNKIFETLTNPSEVPNIEFFTFGGTSPAYSNIYTYRYTLKSLLPRVKLSKPWPHYKWTAKPTKLPVSPLLNGIPDFLVHDEQKDGRGDGLVTDVSASLLPDAPHQSFPINHVEALYDETLFSAVLALLAPNFSIDVAEGVPNFLRAHSVGGGFGPPSDKIDVEAVVKLDTFPTRAFGVKLRPDTTSSSQLQMFKLLRDAFREGHRVRIEFLHTGFNNGEIIRVARAA